MPLVPLDGLHLSGLACIFKLLPSTAAQILAYHSYTICQMRPEYGLLGWHRLRNCVTALFNLPPSNFTNTVCHPIFSKHLPQRLLNSSHFSKIMALKFDTMTPVKCYQLEVKTVYY
jgi:hypothetical protein